MIIQIKDSVTKQWLNRTQTQEPELTKELTALKKIYRFNEFRIIEGDEELPGPIYHNKTDLEIDRIVKGIDWLMTQPKDARYSRKVLKVMQL